MLNIKLRRQSRTSAFLPAAIAAPLSALGGFLAGFLLFRQRNRDGDATISSKRVDEAMTPNPRSVAPAASAAEAARLMRSENVGALPVVENERLVGLVTDRDIALRVVAEGEDAQATKVGQIATAEIVTVRPESELDAALELMAKHQVRRLPVVLDDRLVGIVAQADVALEGVDGKTGEVVEQISQ